MLDPSTTALLATLIGGSLAIVGGIAGNYYLTSRTIKTEKRREFRSIFEEFSKYVYDIQICFGRTLLYPTTLNEERIKIVELEGRIVILQMLYAPSLEKDCILFTDALGKATDALAEYFHTQDENKYSSQIDDFMIYAYKFRCHSDCCVPKSCIDSSSRDAIYGLVVIASEAGSREEVNLIASSFTKSDQEPLDQDSSDHAPHQRSDPSHEDQTIDGREEADQPFPDKIGILHSRNKFP